MKVYITEDINDIDQSNPNFINAISMPYKKSFTLVEELKRDLKEESDKLIIYTSFPQIIASVDRKKVFIKNDKNEWVNPDYEDDIEQTFGASTDIIQEGLLNIKNDLPSIVSNLIEELYKKVENSSSIDALESIKKETRVLGDSIEKDLLKASILKKIKKLKQRNKK